MSKGHLNNNEDEWFDWRPETDTPLLIPIPSHGWWWLSVSYIHWDSPERTRRTSVYAPSAFPRFRPHPMNGIWVTIKLSIDIGKTSENHKPRSSISITHKWTIPWKLGTPLSLSAKQCKRSEVPGGSIRSSNFGVPWGDPKTHRDIRQPHGFYPLVN